MPTVRKQGWPPEGSRPIYFPLDPRADLVLDNSMIQKITLLLASLLLASGTIAKPRLIVLTDITNEPDDEQLSLIHI